MSKRRPMLGMIVGVFVSMTACAASVEETEMADAEVGEVDQALMDSRISWPWILRPNVIDPGGRLLRCLPDPRKRYLARDVDVCAGIRFYCAEGVPFFDRCGCGCQIGVSPE